MSAHTIEAELTWTGKSFEEGIEVTVDASGRIGALRPGDGSADRIMKGRALMPGMINAHSHSFQRALRGRGETFPGASGDFWTWRQAMYKLVENLEAHSFQAVCVGAFREMLCAGITSVGEFHYLRHSGLGKNDYAFDRLILDAARQAGIRIVLLNAFYRTGGVNQPLSPAQSRFATRSLEEYWEQHDVLASMVKAETQSIGVVAHSIRAASIEEIRSLHAESLRRGLVFHMHLEEQQQEIDDCRAAYGHSPMDLVNDRLEVGPNFTGIHCTRSAPKALEEFLDAGANICVTPLTEANLGDGIPDRAVFSRGMERISLGTDSNARISMLEEMRWLEYGQRLSSRERGMLRQAGGAVAPSLFSAATEGGARSLGIEAGRIAPGLLADFFTVDLAAPLLDGWEKSCLLESIVFGSSEEIVRDVCVGGSWVNVRHG